MFDSTITAGNLIEAGMFLFGAIGAIATLRTIVKQLVKDVDTIKTDIKKLNEVITKQAVQDQRILNIEQDLRELKHGEGFIRGPRGIDREFA